MRKNNPNLIATQCTIKANRNHVCDLFLGHHFKRKRISLKSFTCMWRVIGTGAPNHSACPTHESMELTTKVWEAQTKRNPKINSPLASEKVNITFPMDWEITNSGAVFAPFTNNRNHSNPSQPLTTRSRSFQNDNFMPQASSSKERRCYCKNRSFQAEKKLRLVRIVYEEDFAFQQNSLSTQQWQHGCM